MAVVRHRRGTKGGDVRFAGVLRFCGAMFFVALQVAPPYALGGAKLGAEERAFTLTGAQVLQPDGTLAKGLAVVVSGDRIMRVVSATQVDLPDPRRLSETSVLSPGLVDLCSSIAAYGEPVEVARAVDPGASARSAIDPQHRDLRLALEAGVTCAMVCPSPSNVISGSAVTFRTALLDERLDVLEEDGPLVFALGRPVLRGDRGPTSRGGARNLLRDALEAARRGDGHPRVRSFLDGHKPGLVFCSAEPDVRVALEVFDAFDRTPAVAHSSDAPLGATVDFAKAMAGRNAIAVIGPFDFRTPERLLMTAGILDAADVKVSFRGALPVRSRDSLRVTAAMAVRHGMKTAAARRALTSVAAEVAGTADRVGAIAPGKAADLVIFSGDPLRLDSRVLEVYVRGARVYKAGTR